jgi:hypothetical protein
MRHQEHDMGGKMELEISHFCRFYFKVLDGSLTIGVSKQDLLVLILSIPHRFGRQDIRLHL